MLCTNKIHLTIFPCSISNGFRMQEVSKIAFVLSFLEHFNKVYIIVKTEIPVTLKKKPTKPKTI